MEQDLEHMTEHSLDIEQIPMDAAEALVRRLKATHPNYKGLGESGMKGLAKQLTENPAQYWSLIDEIPDVTFSDINTQLERLTEVLNVAEVAKEKAWTPKNPAAFYTPQEMSQLKKEEMKDTYLGWIIGDDHAVNYQDALLPLVRKRYQESVIGTLKSADSTLEELTSRLEKDCDAKRDGLFDYKLEVDRLMNHLDIADGRKIELSAEIDELQKDVNKYSQAGDLERARELMAQLKEKKEEGKNYRQLETKASNGIIVKEQQILQSRGYLAMMIPLTQRLERFSAKMNLVYQRVQEHVTGAISVVNPATISRLTNIYQQAEVILKQLDDAFVQTVNGVTEKIPSEFTPNTLYEPKGLDTLSTGEQNYLLARTEELKLAKQKGEAIRKMDLIY